MINARIRNTLGVRLVVAVMSTLILWGMASTGEAAAPRVSTLYFDDATEAASGVSCRPDFVLVSRPLDGRPCGSVAVAAAGKGQPADQVFDSARTAVGFRVDARRKLTGVVYLTQWVLNSDCTPSGMTVSVPQCSWRPALLLGARVTIEINGKTVGSVARDAAPTAAGYLEIRFDFALPRSLQGAVVRSISAEVEFLTAAGKTQVSKESRHRSQLTVPRL